jgi:hypothetical protein
MIPPGQEFTADEQRTLAISAYNLSCTYAVLQARSKDEETKKAGIERTYHWLQKCAEFGFLKLGASPCPKNRGDHTGKEHAAHDDDFEQLRNEPTFKKILEWREEH